ncbi:MAG TPA: hypothetical protein VGI55_07280 [Solirubrobacteraceae bacterium]|jgi:hypothetical protein
MNEVSERLGHNEALFRSINERIEAGIWPATPSESVAFRCECAALGCNVLVELTIAEYESVRANPRQFLLAPGHEIPAVEQVIRRTDDYVVVQKLGDAGRVADTTDPR